MTKQSIFEKLHALWRIRNRVNRLKMSILLLFWEPSTKIRHILIVWFLWFYLIHFILFHFINFFHKTNLERITESQMNITVGICKTCGRRPGNTRLDDRYRRWLVFTGWKWLCTCLKIASLESWRPLLSLIKLQWNLERCCSWGHFRNADDTQGMENEQHHNQKHIWKTDWMALIHIIAQAQNKTVIY